MSGLNIKAKVLLAVSSLFASSSLADVHVSFIEGAPKDKFVVTNIGTCDLPTTKIRIDFSGSSSGLIFDVASSGPGVEVFQPFQIVLGKHLVSGASTVSDGDKSVMMDFDSFCMVQSVGFTIDVDDTTGTREVTVLDSELLGPTVEVTTKNEEFSATFASKSEVLVRIPDCASS